MGRPGRKGTEAENDCEGLLGVSIAKSSSRVQIVFLSSFCFFLSRKLSLVFIFFSFAPFSFFFFLFRSVSVSDAGVFFLLSDVVVYCLGVRFIAGFEIEIELR